MALITCGELIVVHSPLQATHRSPSFESTRHQNDSWESCSVIEPSVEHSRKLKTNANPGFFSRSFQLAYVDTVDAVRVISVCT